jgi:hypothetical protein
MADGRTVFVRLPSYCCAFGQRLSKAQEKFVVKHFYSVILKAAKVH